MCGRFSLAITSDEFHDYMKKLFTHPVYTYDEDLPNFNISPSSTVYAALFDGTSYRIGKLQFGIPKKNFLLINTKAETFLSIQDMNHRCVLFADGFFEWNHASNSKQPFRFRRKDRGLFGLAATWESYFDSNGNKCFGASVLTVPANALVDQVHDRMPLMLYDDEIKSWLSGDKNHIISFISNYTQTSLEYYKVSTYMNYTKHNDIECITPIP